MVYVFLGIERGEVRGEVGEGLNNFDGGLGDWGVKWGKEGERGGGEGNGWNSKWGGVWG